MDLFVVSSEEALIDALLESSLLGVARVVFFVV